MSANCLRSDMLNVYVRLFTRCTSSKETRMPPMCRSFISCFVSLNISKVFFFIIIVNALWMCFHWAFAVVANKGRNQTYF